MSPTQKKALILAGAAFSGWAVNLWLYPHHPVPGFETASTAPPPAPPAPNPPYYQPAAAPVPRNTSSPQAQSPSSTALESAIGDDSETTLKKRRYPDSIAQILGPSDWPYVCSAVIVANGLDARMQHVKWFNPQTGDSGEVVLTDTVEDVNGCRPFRVTRMLAGAQDKKRSAYMNFCRDGTMK